MVHATNFASPAVAGRIVGSLIPEHLRPTARGQAYNGDPTASSLELTAERGGRLRWRVVARPPRRLLREPHSTKGSRWIPTNFTRSKPRSKAPSGGSPSIGRTD